jgi:hypothetical protein
MTFTRRFVKVNTGGPGEEGCLLFDNGDALVAVLVRLSDKHDSKYAGKWFFEHRIEIRNYHGHPLLNDIIEAENWMASRKVK